MYLTRAPCALLVVASRSYVFVLWSRCLFGGHRKQRNHVTPGPLVGDRDQRACGDEMCVTRAFARS
jgi:hypothetical protein